MRGIRVDVPQSYQRIELTARNVRDVLVPGLKVAAAIPGVEVFERLGQYSVTVGDRHVGLTCGVEELPFAVEAVTRYEASEDTIAVVLAEQTYRELEVEQPRARFSTFHEIGHAVLHASDLVRLSRMPHEELGLRRQADHANFLDSEWQANAFAAALLMPADGLAELERLHGPAWIAKVQETFKVSSLATDIRCDVYRRRKSQLI